MGITGVQCGLLRANIALEHCTDVFISKCMFRDNFSGALIIHRSLQLLVEDTTFFNNSGSSSYSNVPQLDISISDNGFRTAGGLTVSFKKLSSLTYALIKNCTFKNNRASINESNKEDASQRPLFYVPRGHGGGLLVAFENSSNHVVTVENCSFVGNSAQIGGGATSILFYRGSSDVSRFGVSSSRNNSVSIVGNYFCNNEVEGGGGAIQGLAFEEAIDNDIIIQNCSIINNSAGIAGGGLLIVLQVDVTLFPNVVVPIDLTIDSTLFEGNLSPSGKGGAIALLAFINVIQIIKAASISQCTFSRNHAESGAIYSYRFPISMEDQNQWIGNSNSALFLFDSKLDFKGDFSFLDNRGDKGGAIQMNGNSKIKLFENSNLTFMRNSASQGGAVYVAAPALVLDADFRRLSYSNCFIRYVEPDAPISNWTATLSFVDNMATDFGGAIYYTDIYLCKYDSIEVIRQGDSRPLLFDLPIFNFRNNVVANKVENIASEAFVLRTSLENDTLTGAPGQKLSFFIQCEDRIGQDQSCIYSSTTSEGLFFLPRKGLLIEHEVQQLDAYLMERYNNHCSSDPDNEVAIRFTLIEGTTGEFLSTTQIHVIITCCRPGFELQNGTCVFKKGNSAILREDREKKFLYLEPQHYAQVRNGNIVTAAMPIFYRNCTQQGNITGCLFKQEQSENQCHGGRTGFLCGVCPNGTSNDLSLSTCITCHGWHTFFIVAIVLFFIFISALIMIYNFELTNELKGFIFYVQVIGFIYEFGEFTGGAITWDFHFVNILGFSLYFPLCPYPGYNALYTAVLGFILPCVVVVTIATYILSARFIKRLSNKTSFDGIWFLTFFIYKLIADICFKILHCEKVNDGDKNEYVYSYDGNLKCFSTEDPAHLVFAVGALLLSMAVFAFPIFILIISFRRFQLTQNITDVLNKGIKSSRRWWSSFDLFRRIFIIYTLLILSYLSPQYSQLALLICSLIIFIVFALAAPYTSKKAIYIETALLLDLIVIICISLNTKNSTRQRLRPFSLILLLSPYVVIFTYLIMRGILFICGYITCPMDIQIKWALLREKLREVTDTEDKNPALVDDVTFSTADTTLTDYDMHSDDYYRVVLPEPTLSHNTISFTKYREALLTDTVDNPV